MWINTKFLPICHVRDVKKFQIFPHLSFIVVLWFRLFVISALLSKICAVLCGEKLYQSYGHKITNMRYNPEDATHCMIHTDCIWGPFLPGVFSNVSSIPLFETLIERKQTHTGFPNWGLNSSVTQSFWKGEDEKPQPVLWARVDGRPMRASIYIWGSWHVLSPRIGSPVFLPLQNLTFGIRHHLRGSFMGMKGIHQRDLLSFAAKVSHVLDIGPKFRGCWSCLRRQQEIKKYGKYVNTR